MNWLEALDIYCERTGPGLFAEPVNALTNLAFVLVAASVSRHAGPRPSPDLRLLIALAIAVGFGSAVFHTVAQRWASVLDIGFIAVFVLVFMHRALAGLLGWPARSAGAGMIVFLAASALIAFAVRIPALNGSDLYLGPLLALTGLAAACPQPDAARWLRAASALFVLALACRSLDLRVCETFPIGTHFGWHLCVAATMWCCMRALLSAHSTPSTATGPAATG